MAESFRMISNSDEAPDKKCKCFGKKTLIITGCVFGGFIFALLMADGRIFNRKKYLDAFELDYINDFTDKRSKLISRGILASNSHNTQSWRFIFNANNENIFDMYLNHDRLTPQCDPYSRQITISAGTLIEYLKVAADIQGINLNIQYFPSGEYDQNGTIESIKAHPIARFTISTKAAVTNDLHQYMFKADTTRSNYKAEKIKANEIAHLNTLNNEPTLNLTIVNNDADMNTLHSIVKRAGYIEADVKRVQTEVLHYFRLNEWQKNKYGNGLVFEGSGTTGFMNFLMQGFLTLLPFAMNEDASAKSFKGSIDAIVSNTPHYIIIDSNDNSRLSQVKAGELYSRIILNAHKFGIALQPVSQPLEEYSEMSNEYQNIHSQFTTPGKTIQILARLGYPTKEGALSPRMPVNRLIE